MKNKRLFFSLILGMLFVIFINTKSINIIAQDEVDTSSYANMKETIEEVNTLDEEAIDKYRQYVSVVDGKYMFSYTGEENEDVLFIQENINSINELVLDGEAYILEDEVILERDEELAVQFGISNVKWKWYGINVTMNKEMIVTVCIAALLINVMTAKTLKRILNNREYSSLVSGIESIVCQNFGTASKMATTFGNKTYSLLIDKFGSYNKICSTINSVLSTIIFAGAGVLTAACFASGGAAAVVWSIISYIIGTFTPGLIQTITLFALTVLGITNSATMKIRWLRGWGTNFSYSLN